MKPRRYEKVTTISTGHVSWYVYEEGTFDPIAQFVREADAISCVATPWLIDALDNIVGPGAQRVDYCDTAEHDNYSDCVWCEARSALRKAGVRTLE